MPKHATVVTKYTCEYGEYSFANAADEVFHMLIDNDIEVWTSNEDNRYCNWEIDAYDKAEDLKALIAEFMALPSDEINCYFTDHPDAAHFTNRNVINALKKWTRHIIDDRIHVHWF